MVVVVFALPTLSIQLVLPFQLFKRYYFRPYRFISLKAIEFVYKSGFAVNIIMHYILIVNCK